MATLQDVLTTARTYLNDDLAQQFPDPYLIPKVQEAHRELQEQLWQVGSPVVRAQSAPLAYTANSTTFPTLPTDLLCPTQLFENAAGSTITAAGWTPMTEVYYLPLGVALAATLIYWCWQQEQIQIIGATVNRAVIVQYRRKITIPVANGDPVGILFGESYLAARAAALGAGTLMNGELFTQLSALAKENLNYVIAANRGQQRPLLKP